MLMRMIDSLKGRGATALFTSLTSNGSPIESSEVGVSSLMDTWLLLRNAETSAERDRLLFIVKSRGMAHSNQVREFLLTDQGVHLADVYVGSGTVLTGSARLVQEAKDRAQIATEKQTITRRRRELKQEQTLARAQLEAMQLKTAALGEEIRSLASDEQARVATATHEQAELARARGGDAKTNTTGKGRSRNASQRK